MVLKGVKFEILVYDVCEKAKHHKHSYNYESIQRRNTPLQLIYHDVWGCAPLSEIHGFKWFLVCVVDFNNFTLTYVLKHKLKVTKNYFILND